MPRQRSAHARRVDDLRSALLVRSGHHPAAVDHHERHGHQRPASARRRARRAAAAPGARIASTRADHRERERQRKAAGSANRNSHAGASTTSPLTTTATELDRPAGSSSSAATIAMNFTIRVAIRRATVRRSGVQHDLRDSTRSTAQHKRRQRAHRDPPAPRRWRVLPLALPVRDQRLERAANGALRQTTAMRMRAREM